jgi:hypothetical protein
VNLAKDAKDKIFMIIDKGGATMCFLFGDLSSDFSWSIL